MKIVQLVTRSDNIGGAQVHIKDLSLELHKRGHEILVMVGGNGPFIEEIQSCGLPVWPLRNLVRSVHPHYDWWAFWEIRKALKKVKPDLVATHTSKAGLIGRLAAYSLGIPAIFTAHGWSYIQESSKLMQKGYLLAEKLAGHFSAGMITVSEYDRKFCLKHRLISDKKVVTILNGIPDISKCIARQGPEVPRLVMTARLERPKNHLDLLQALVPVKRLKWEMDLVGDGPLRSQVEQTVKRLGLETRVRFLGTRTDIPEILSQAQIFVLVSDMEGLPLSILEAMRAYLPIIATDVGGISEIVDDGYNGFLVPRGDVKCLTDRISVLTGNEKLRLEMGLAAREKFEKLFKADNMVEKTISIYEDVVSSAYGNSIKNQEGIWF